MQKGTLSLNELKRSYLPRFQITARQFNSIRVALEGKIDSYKELRKLQVEALKTSIPTFEKKLRKIKRSDKLHHKTRVLLAKKQKLARLEQEIKDGTVSLCFGGRHLFHKQFFLKQNGYTSHEEWKKDWDFARSSSFFLLGSKDEASGNQSATLTGEDQFQLRLRLPDFFAGSKYIHLQNLEFNRGHKHLLQALKEKQAISYRFKEDKKGFRVFASFSRVRPQVITNRELGAIGVDINADHLAIVETDRNGNPIYKKTIPLCTYGKTKAQSKAIIGDACKEAVLFAKEVKKPLITEDLDFKKKKASLRESPNPKYARMLSSFSYKAILENLDRKSFEEGVAIDSVSPAYTSIIGKCKFSKRYGLSSHHAAALCIARRFFRFSESPSKCLMKVVHKNIQVTPSLPVRNRGEHVWKFWAVAKRRLQTALVAHTQGSAGPRKSPGMRRARSS